MWRHLKSERSLLESYQFFFSLTSMHPDCLAIHISGYLGPKQIDEFAEEQIRMTDS